MDPSELPPNVWPDYATLADVLPAVDAALRDSPSTSVPIPPGRDAVVLLIDGLGSVLLDEFASHAPTLTSLRSTVLRAGFPATTATSTTSLMMGAPCGSHGIIGYSFRLSSPGRTLNALRWTFDRSDGPSALDSIAPEDVQPLPGLITDMADRGVEVTYVMPGIFEGSGLTRAAFRAPGTFRPATNPDEIRRQVTAALSPTGQTRRLVYAYWSELDMAGHIHGPGSTEWVAALGNADRLVADLAADLPAGTILAVTGDHGMVRAEHRIDIDTTPGLLDGVDEVAGEMRVRHVYTAPGRSDAVLSTWRGALGDHAYAVPRDQVLDEHWFGPHTTDAVRERIGDLVAVARGTSILTRTLNEPTYENNMPGHHGAWTADEQLVPLLLHQN